MELKTHEQITEHLRSLRDILMRRHGWRLDRMADEIGVKKHTLVQYGLHPETRGSRQIPAKHLTYLRSAVVELDRERWDQYFPTYLGREEKAWFVLNPDLSVSLETHNLFAAECYAARFEGLSAIPGPDNTNPHEELSDHQKLCVEWIRMVEGGWVGRDDVVAVTGANEYELDLIACPQLQWRIQPTEEWVRALRQKARERYDRDIEERRLRDAA